MKVFLELLDNKKFSFKLEGFNKIINTDVEITNEDYKKWKGYERLGKSFRLKENPSGVTLFDYIEEYIPEIAEATPETGIEELVLDHEYRLSKIELGV